MAWKCKKCGREIIVKAVLKGEYPVFLDKNKKITDNDDFDVLCYSTADIQRIYCGCGKWWCNTIDNLEEIAVWED